MIRAVGLQHTPEGPAGGELWAGVFRDGKSKGEGRCISDRRHRYWAEKKRPGRKTSHGMHYRKAISRPGRVNRYTGFNAPHFDHNVRPRKNHWKHAPTGPPLRKEKTTPLGIPAVEDYGDGGGNLQPRRDTLSMADAKAGPLAQVAHWEMARAARGREELLLDWDMAGPGADCRLSLCIGEFLGEENFPQSVVREPMGATSVMSFVEKMRRVYGDPGMPPKAERLQIKQHTVVSLGAELDDHLGTVGTPCRVLVQVMMLPLHLALSGAATRRAMKKALGLWTAGLMLLHDAFCILEKLCWARKKLAVNCAGKLPLEVIDGLVGLALCGPLLRGNMRGKPPTLFSLSLIHI